MGVVGFWLRLMAQKHESHPVAIGTCFSISGLGPPDSSPRVDFIGLSANSSAQPATCTPQCNLERPIIEPRFDQIPASPCHAPRPIGERVLFLAAHETPPNGYAWPRSGVPLGRRGGGIGALPC